MDFCQNCGARLTPNSDFCPICGARCVRSAAPVPPPARPAPRPQPEPPESSQPDFSQPEPQAPGPQTPPSAAGPRYCAPDTAPSDAPSVWWYFGMLLLFAVPVVGLVAMLCFSLLPGCSRQQRNLARACLLLALILAAVLALGIFLFTLLLGSWQQTMLYSYYGIY